jgi:FemAB-related protein (PEP-CTERM system-associated)
MDIKYLDSSSMERWDRFVESHPMATFFHKSGWSLVIKNTFGHIPYYLYAEENGEILGILPLGHVRSFLFGNALISTPFCVYGGIVYNTEQARLALDNAACELAKNLKVDYLELRNIQSSGTGRTCNHLYVTFRKMLSTDNEQNFMSIPRKQRAMVRKAITFGLNSVVDSDVERFYNIYAESVRNLGTPVFGKRLFQVLLDVFGSDCEIISIEQHGRVVSSVMSFYFRNEILPYYGGGSSIARDLNANDYMYWEVMRRAAERGVFVFDFGRSKNGTGSYKFKSHWGFTPTPLYYEYECIANNKIPDINPLNPKYKLLIIAWKHLPLQLSKLIGPFISRNLV